MSSGRPQPPGLALVLALALGSLCAAADDVGFAPRVHHRPVILVPGVGGTRLEARERETGDSRVVWIRALFADSTFRDHLWSRYNATSQRTESLNPDWDIFVSEARSGLDGIENLAPGLLIDIDAVKYFERWVELFLDVGYEPGRNLFGFPYDWRQSTAYKGHLDGLLDRIKHAYHRGGEQRVSIVSHSMGGLLVRALLAQYPRETEELIHTWVAVSVPFQGAAGFALKALIQGHDFGNKLIKMRSTRTLFIECASMYELLPSPLFNWRTAPRLSYRLLDGQFKSHGMATYVDVIRRALKHNKVKQASGESLFFDFNDLLYNKSMEIRRQRTKLHDGSSQILFYNVYSADDDTPFDVTFEEPVKKSLKELLGQEPVFSYTAGDGSVPLESLLGDEMDAVERIRIPKADHAQIIKTGESFRQLMRLLGMACPWHGLWETGEGTFFLQETLAQVRSREPKHLHRIGVRRGHIWDPEIQSLTGQVVGTRLEGQYTAPGGGRRFTLQLDTDCMEFQGTWEYEVPTSTGPQSWSGKRLIGKDCEAYQTVPCSVINGRGHNECQYGFFSVRCFLDECNDGFMPNARDPFRASACDRCPEKITTGFERRHCGERRVDVTEVVIGSAASLAGRSVVLLLWSIPGFLFGFVLAVYLIRKRPARVAEWSTMPTIQRIRDMALSCRWWIVSCSDRIYFRLRDSTDPAEEMYVDPSPMLRDKGL